MFRAHTDADLLCRWLGPRRVTMRIDHYDCRTGGSYRYIHRSGGVEHGFHGSFHEVQPVRSIVQTFTYEGAPDSVALQRMTLDALDGGRTRLHITSLMPSFAERDAFLRSGMEEGAREGYERLDELLAG